MNEVRLRWIVRAATAVFGLSLGISIAARVTIRAQAGDLVSALQAAGHHPREVLVQFLLAVIGTAVFAMIGERMARLLVPSSQWGAAAPGGAGAGEEAPPRAAAPHRAKPWAAVAYSALLFLSPVTLMFYGNIRHVVLMGAAAAVVVALRKRDPRFSPGDAVLLFVALACYMAFLDVGFGNTPVAALFRALLAVFLMRLVVGPSDVWVASPLTLLVVMGWLPAKTGGWIGLAIIFLTPFVLERVRWRPPRKVVYPILAFVYPLAVLTVPLNGFAVNFYEDSHEIPVASEMMRGETPYNDIVPQHGFISDGGLHWIAMKFGARSLRELLNARLYIGVIATVAIYCLALAATGSLELALVATFLAVCLYPHTTIFFRPSAAVFALAAAVAATRLRSRRWFFIAGALVIAAILVSVDFGIYAFVVAVFAAFRARALRSFFLGFGAAAIPVLLLFTILGFVVEFLRTTAVDIVGGHAAYFVSPLRIPDCLRTPALLHVLPQCVSPLVWMLALVASCVAFAGSPLRARRSDGPWLIGAWMVLAGTAYTSRGNFYFNPVVLPFVAGALWRLSRYARTVAIVLAVAVVLLAEPFKHAISFIPQMREAGPTPLYDPATAESVQAVERFVATLKPDETFLDFSNAALLYTITNRDMPVRHIEVAQYESEASQREVIRALEANPKIVAALVSFRGSIAAVDGIPNAARAPLVWAYLQQHFTPAFDEAGVAFWRRRAAAP